MAVGLLPCHVPNGHVTRLSFVEPGSRSLARDRRNHVTFGFPRQRLGPTDRIRLSARSYRIRPSAKSYRIRIVANTVRSGEARDTVHGEARNVRKHIEEGLCSL